MYNWQQKDWPKFEYRQSDFNSFAMEFISIAGQSHGYMQSLSDKIKEESLTDILVKEALSTSAIEGEFLSRADVMSSVKRNLGFPTPAHIIKDKRAYGLATLMVKVRQDFELKLTNETLFEWHKLLFSANQSVKTGQYRTHTEPMQVVSGPAGKEVVHFEAPPSIDVPREMDAFCLWFNSTMPIGQNPIENPLIRAAVAHLYFESIHPFEDGNGRIGRAISEKAIAQGLKRPILMSLSSAIEKDKMSYYQALNDAQTRNNVPGWIEYFCKTVLAAQYSFLDSIQFLVRKTSFFDKFSMQINSAQMKVINKMFESGPDEFKGGMNAKKYQSITKLSKATATRHLQDLLQKGILVSKGGGRSTNYQLNFEN
ncbi:MAG: Fic family protein [Saprospiraceae bacterium]|nr:Fic family protein [Saprospiraceae bacterium]